MEQIDNLLVVKVGTSTLISDEAIKYGEIDPKPFEIIGSEINKFHKHGKHIVLVTSGAITAGMIETNITKRPHKKGKMPELQRLAAIGWRTILNSWSDALYPSTTSSMLLTRRELSEDKKEKNEFLKVTHASLSHGDIVIVNENDTISHEEIEYGDNDRLSAHLAKGIGESSLFGSNIELVLLSDVHGVYENPDDKTTIVRHIKNASDYMWVARQSSHEHGRGGMVSKLEAAQIANRAGIDMWIANGSEKHAIRRVLNDEIGTHFYANMYA
jgi:glutamate 5-kinase